MRHRTPIIGWIVILLLVAAVAVASADGVPTQETPLTTGGKVYEVNRDARGNIFVSDADAQEVWRVQPDDHYVRYASLPSLPQDARPDASGNIWWTDWATTFGRIDVATDEVTTWNVADGQNLGGLAFDETGGVWLTHSYRSSGPLLYRFDPAPGAAQPLCAYQWSGGGVGEGASDYVLYSAGQVWLGDWANHRILRINALSNEVRWWQHPSNSQSRPNGLAMDGLGNLWWADSGWKALARLTPSNDQVTIYALPLGTFPQMLSLAGGSVWYTDFGGSGAVGALQPAEAAGSSTIMSTGTLQATRMCSTLGTPTSATVTATSGTLAWSSPIDIVPTTPSAGWRIYALPQGAQLYGIARGTGSLWVADQGRQRLVRLVVGAAGRINLPIILR